MKTEHEEFTSAVFAAEIEKLWDRNDFNFGSSKPYDVVKEALLKTVCGWCNGSVADSILDSLELVDRRSTKRAKLTRKGRAFLWQAYGKYVQ